MLENPMALMSAPLAALNKGKLADGSFTWGDTLNVTFCGISIVFSMLVLLVLVIVVFGIIMKSANGKSSKNSTVTNAESIKETTAPVVTVQNDDNDEVIAVITAAVNAMYESSGVKPVIRSIRKNNSKAARSPWASAGVMENTRGF